MATEATSPLSATPRATRPYLDLVQLRLAGHERAQRSEVQPYLQVVLDQHAFRERRHREPDRALGSLRGAHLTAESDPARQLLHLHALQIRIGGQQCTQRPDIEGHTQVVLDQHALGQRGGREPHRALGRGNGGDLAAQRHAPRDTLHLHPVQPCLAGQKHAQRSEVEPNFQVVLDQHAFRERRHREPDRALGSLRGAHPATEGHPACQPLHLHVLQIRVCGQQCT